MRHSLNYGLLKDVDLSDEKIKAALPKDALAELEKTCSRKSQPASFLVKQILEEMPAKTEFSVSDMFIKLHSGEQAILVKMATLRSTLSTLAKNGKAGIEIANADAKHRLYRKK
jgi:hypothetical protein